MGPGSHKVHFQKEEMMKTRILLIAVALLAATLSATSCSKADFLEGTFWHCDDEDIDGDLFFVNKMECRLLLQSGRLLGEYSVDKSDISVKFYGMGEMNGTIKGNTITLTPAWHQDVTLTFKKKK